MLTRVQLTSASCLHVTVGVCSFEDDLEEIQILNCGLYPVNQFYFYGQHYTMGKCTSGVWPNFLAFRQLFDYLENQ